MKKLLLLLLLSAGANAAESQIKNTDYASDVSCWSGHFPIYQGESVGEVHADQGITLFIDTKTKRVVTFQNATCKITVKKEVPNV